MTRNTCLGIIGKSCLFILSGFCGGFLSWAFIAWLKPIWAQEGYDGVSIVNTYIVFTSFIFVAFTVFLAIAGFVFTQQFSYNREIHVSDAFDHIKKTVQKDDRVATSLVSAILESPDGKRFLKDMLESKVESLIQNRSNMLAQQALAAGSLTTSPNPNSVNGTNSWAATQTSKISTQTSNHQEV